MPSPMGSPAGPRARSPLGARGRSPSPVSPTPSSTSFVVHNVRRQPGGVSADPSPTPSPAGFSFAEQHQQLQRRQEQEERRTVERERQRHFHQHAGGPNQRRGPPGHRHHQEIGDDDDDEEEEEDGDDGDDQSRRQRAMSFQGAQHPSGIRQALSRHEAHVERGRSPTRTNSVASIQHRQSGPPPIGPLDLPEPVANPPLANRSPGASPSRVSFRDLPTPTRTPTRDAASPQLGASPTPSESGLSGKLAGAIGGLFGMRKDRSRSRSGERNVVWSMGREGSDDRASPLGIPFDKLAPRRSNEGVSSSSRSASPISPGPGGRSPKRERDREYEHEPMPLASNLVLKPSEVERRPNMTLAEIEREAEMQRARTRRQAQAIVDREREEAIRSPTQSHGPGQGGAWNPRQALLDEDEDAFVPPPLAALRAQQAQAFSSRRKPVPPLDEDGQGNPTDPSDGLTPAQRIVLQARSRDSSRERSPASSLQGLSPGQIVNAADGVVTPARQPVVQHGFHAPSRSPQQRYSMPPGPYGRATSDGSPISGPTTPGSQHGVGAFHSPSPAGQPPFFGAESPSRPPLFKRHSAQHIPSHGGGSPSQMPPPHAQPITTLPHAMHDLAKRFYRFESYAVPLLRSFERRLDDIECDNKAAFAAASMSDVSRDRSGNGLTLSNLLQGQKGREKDKGKEKQKEGELDMEEVEAEMDRWVAKLVEMMRREVGQLRVGCAELARGRETLGRVAFGIQRGQVTGLARSPSTRSNSAVGSPPQARKDRSADDGPSPGRRAPVDGRQRARAATSPSPADVPGKGGSTSHSQAASQSSTSTSALVVRARAAHQAMAAHQDLAEPDRPSAATRRGDGGTARPDGTPEVARTHGHGKRSTNATTSTLASAKPARDGHGNEASAETTASAFTYRSHRREASKGTTQGGTQAAGAAEPMTPSRRRGGHHERESSTSPSPRKRYTSALSGGIVEGRISPNREPGAAAAPGKMGPEGGEEVAGRMGKEGRERQRRQSTGSALLSPPAASTVVTGGDSEVSGSAYSRRQSAFVSSASSGTASTPPSSVHPLPTSPASSSAADKDKDKRISFPRSTSPSSYAPPPLSPGGAAVLNARASAGLRARAQSYLQQTDKEAVLSAPSSPNTKIPTPRSPVGGGGGGGVGIALPRSASPARFSPTLEREREREGPAAARKTTTAALGHRRAQSQQTVEAAASAPRPRPQSSYVPRSSTTTPGAAAPAAAAIGNGIEGGGGRGARVGQKKLGDLVKFFDGQA